MSDADIVDVIDPVKRPWDFSEKWYGLDEIAACIQRQRFLSFEGDKVPADIYGQPFAEWLTHQYRLAMCKGIQVARDKCHDEITSLRTELAAMRERVEWRPIETAPRKERFLDAWMFQGEWKQCVCYLTDDDSRILSWPGGWRYDPTHWMPLPPIPDTPKETGE